MFLTYNSIELYQILLALCLLLAGTFLGRKCAEVLKAPRFIGELAAGLLIGPTCLSNLFPRIPNIFAAPGVNHALALIYELGLLLLMYGSGLKLSKTFGHGEKSFIVKLFLGGLILPLGVGIGLGPTMHVSWSIPTVSPSIFGLFLGLSFAITSIPVISKILSDLDLTKTNFARIVLSTAVLEDIFLFVALAILLNLPFDTKLLSTPFLFSLTKASSLVRILIPIIFLLICWYGGMWAQKYSRTRIVLSHPWAQGIPFHLMTLISIVLIGLALNVPSFLSSFGAGLLAQHFSHQDLSEGELHALERFSMSFFIPLYFCLVGLKLNLLQDFSFIQFLSLFILGFASKMVGIFLAANSRKEIRLDLIWALNARGGPGIVMAGLGISSGLINEKLAASLVMVAVVSSLTAGIWLRKRQHAIQNMDKL